MGSHRFIASTVQRPSDMRRCADASQEHFVTESRLGQGKFLGKVVVVSDCNLI